jgi:hypothetical protein
MKKLIIEEEIETEIKNYQDCNINNLIIAITNEHTLLLKQLTKSYWTWIDILSSDSLYDNTNISYESVQQIIKSKIKEGFSIYEIEDWEEYVNNF